MNNQYQMDCWGRLVKYDGYNYYWLTTQYGFWKLISEEYTKSIFFKLDLNQLDKTPGYRELVISEIKGKFYKELLEEI